MTVLTLANTNGKKMVAVNPRTVLLVTAIDNNVTRILIAPGCDVVVVGSFDETIARLDADMGAK